jgi:hypothetical protein
MTFTVKLVANGWVVELWRDRVKREEHVFLTRGELLAFLADIVEEAH